MENNKKPVDIKITCGFSPIIGQQYFRTSTWVKGVALSESRHVSKVVETISNGEEITIKSKCLPQTNVNSKEYNVLLKIQKSSRTLTEAHCDCRAGIAGQCKHVAATVVCINTEKAQSRTSTQQAWGIPSKKRNYKPGERIQSMFPKMNQEANNKNLLAAPVTSILSYFPDLQCPLVEMLKVPTEQEDSSTIACLISEMVENIHTDGEAEMLQNILKSRQELCLESYSKFPSFNLSPDAQQYYKLHVELPLQKVIKLSCETIKQYLSSAWGRERKLRISSTKAHRIYRRKTDTSKLAYEMLNEGYFSNLGTRYGLKMEPIACKLFAEQNKLTVISSGVVVNSCNPWLCASPDGIIQENNRVSLLEIKCPYSLKDKPIRNEGVQTCNLRYLKYKDGNIILKEGHEYYTQIQLAMYVTNTLSTYFYVYSPVEQVLCKVNRNDVFLSQCIPKLHSFYFNTYFSILFRGKL